MPIAPKDFLLYWLGAFVLVALYLFARPRGRGFTLRLGSAPRPREIPPAEAPRERPLNVIFQFNGHSWDAYEVLGVPAGSNYETVKAAYLEALATVDPTSREFMTAAFRAIDGAAGRRG